MAVLKSGSCSSCGSACVKATKSFASRRRRLYQCSCCFPPPCLKLWWVHVGAVYGMLVCFTFIPVGHCQSPCQNRLDLSPNFAGTAERKLLKEPRARKQTPGQGRMVGFLSEARAPWFASSRPSYLLPEPCTYLTCTSFSH